MTTGNGKVNGGTIAPLRNVAAFNELVDRTIKRPAHLPGMATFHGFSGFGKTWAAIYATNRHGCRYVEMGQSWTQRKLCSAILAELGMMARGTIADMVDNIVDALATDERPLIIDEADHLVTRGMVELVREIHDKSDVPVVLIGEELLPAKLSKFERIHNRMLDWLPAQPADLSDVRHLAQLYAPEVLIEDDLLQRIADAAQGRIRRICVNLERVRERARVLGAARIDMGLWGEEAFFSGQPPVRRAV